MCVCVRVHAHMCVCPLQSCLAKPYPACSPDKNTGVQCHFKLQTFPTQGSNLCLFHILHWQVDSLVPPRKLKEARGLLKFCTLGISLASFKNLLLDSALFRWQMSHCTLSPLNQDHYRERAAWEFYF